MVSEYILLITIGTAVAAACVRLVKSESDETIRMWSLGWCAFLTAEILGSYVDGFRPEAQLLPLMIAYVASSASTMFFLFGVFALVGWPAPNFVLPIGALIIAARALAGSTGQVETAELLSLPIELGSNLGAGWLVWRSSRKVPRAYNRRGLTAAFLLMACAQTGMALSNIQGDGATGARVVLTTASMALAIMQIIVVIGRSRERVDEAIGVRERDLALLRDIAHLGTRHTTVTSLEDEASALLTDRLRVAWVGFWRWHDREGRLVATGGDALPESVRSDVESIGLVDDALPLERNDRPLQSLRRAPNLLELSTHCDALDRPTCTFIPLDWQGDVIGVIGVGEVANDPIRASVRAVLPTLAGELALSLQHVLSIQQRDRANLELVRERLKLDAILDTAPLGLLVTNADDEIELLNRTAAEHVGCGAPEDWIGRDTKAFMADLFERVSNPNQLLERIQASTNDDGTLVDLEFSIAAPEMRTLRLFSSRVVTDDQRSVARIWATREVTGERALEDQLRHAQKLETLGTLSGGIAHDFNNQLAVILGNARFTRETLDAEHEVPEEIDEALVDLQRAADHCAQLTKSLLSFARRAPVSLDHVQADRLVDELGGLLRPLLPAHIGLTCNVTANLPSIMADAAQLQQVLVNLALNARDAIDGPGEIDINVRVEHVTLERVQRSGVGQPGDHVLFQVGDSGCGLESEALQRIFEPFYTTKPVGQGTGLGLAIVHGVVTAHGGWVEVESELGGGTRFDVHLPVSHTERADSSGAQRIDAIAQEAVSEASDCILVAEDEAAVRRVLVRGLERRGFKIVAVDDGEEAVKRFARGPGEFAAVVLDWSMPGLDGRATAAEIRELDPHVPVLLATGHEAEDDDLIVIRKPFDIDQLARLLGRLISERAH